MDNKRFLYHGKGIELFLIFLKNIFFTIFTLGIYFFWGRTNIQVYLASRLEWAGERFSFHGTGKERFIGFLKALGLVIIGAIIVFAIQMALSFIPVPNLPGTLSYLIILAIFIGIAPFIIVGKRRYLTSRTGYRNLRFGFDGKALELGKIYLRGVLLTVVTLGFYYPWFFVEKEKYLASKTRYGNTHFGFQAHGEEILLLFVKGFLLSIITLGIYSFWFRASIQNYIWNHTSFQEKNFKSDITGGRILGNFIISFLIILFTLGFGLAWVVVRTTKLDFETVSLDTEVDFSTISSQPDVSASATSEGIEALADALESFLG